MKSLIPFVEGDGDVSAVPILLKRLLAEQNAWDVVRLDDRPFRVGEIGKLAKNDFYEWKRKLRACLKRANVGGVIVLLDGDIKKVGGSPFCAATMARSLAGVAVETGAGSTFSVAIVFACQEYESWLIAGIESLAGKRLSDGRLAAPLDAKPPDGDLEKRPRNAKGWLDDRMEGAYRESRHQAELTKLIDLDMIRERKMRSFQRLESAVREIVAAIRENRHVATPTSNS